MVSVLPSAFAAASNSGMSQGRGACAPAGAANARTTAAASRPAAILAAGFAAQVLGFEYCNTGASLGIFSSNREANSFHRGRRDRGETTGRLARPLPLLAAGG